MQNNIRNTNLRFNLGKEQQRRAWEYLQTMDRQDFKSYSQVISLALVDYFDRYYRTQADPYLETREREELFVKQIVDAVAHSNSCFSAQHRYSDVCRLCFHIEFLHNSCEALE